MLLTYALPPLLARFSPPLSSLKAQTAANNEASLSDADFAQYVLAETNTQVAFGTGSGIGDLLGQKQKSLQEAAHTYRQLARTTHAPNMSRRLLILRHAENKSLDETILRDHLIPDLRASGVTASETEAEARLWRALYGATTKKPIAQDGVSEAETRIRAMHLRFLQNRALADLYRAAGQTARADAFQNQMDAEARVFVLQQVLLSLGGLVGGLVGFGLLISFLIAAKQKEWHWIGRVATAPLRLSWGDLLDTFVFYLALFKVIGPVAGFLLARYGTGLAMRERLLVLVAVQVGTGLIGVFYMGVRARQREVTLADIGLTTRGNLWGNILYGILAYFTALPVVLGLGLLAKWIFKHNSNTTPNPVLPMLTGIHDPFGRFLLFLLASVYAPIFEEFFFRGVLFSGLRTRYGWVVSGVITSVCFAVMHPLQDWLPIFGLGFALATVREMRQSLVPGMVMHFLQNTLAFVLLTSLFR